MYIGDTIHDCEIEDLDLDDFDIWKVDNATSRIDG
jgi:hypothetical protein